jgi:hypothetical protein
LPLCSPSCPVVAPGPAAAATTTSAAPAPSASTTFVSPSASPVCGPALGAWCPHRQVAPFVRLLGITQSLSAPAPIAMYQTLHLIQNCRSY